MNDEADHGNLQPWQIFSALFVVFWGTSAYFDHFLMTFVFCIAFGVLGEVLTSYLYGQPATSHGESFSELTKLAQEEHKRIDDQLMEDKSICNEAIWRKEETCHHLSEEEEDAADDGKPPPLPAKDYGNEKEEYVKEVASIYEAASFVKKGNYIVIVPAGMESVEESFDISQVSTPPFELENAEIEEETDVDDQEIFSGSNHTTDDIDKEGKEVEEDNEEVNVFTYKERNSKASLKYSFQKQEDKNFSHIEESYNTIKDATNDQAEQFLYKPSDFEDLLAKKYSLPVDDDEVQLEAKKIYAPDSSDDEELEEEYANIEVDFNESESEEEEFEPKYSNIKTTDSDPDSSKDEKEESQIEDMKRTSGNLKKEEIEIDLTDPKVQEAATKIQTVFKGFQVRKKNKMGLLR